MLGQLTQITQKVIDTGVKWRQEKPGGTFSSLILDEVLYSESKVFGVPLEVAAQQMTLSGHHGPVPVVVVRCIEYLDVIGLKEVGLYRYRIKLIKESLGLCVT